MKVRWIPQRQANEFIEANHRHHNKVVGSITQIGLFDNGILSGCAVLSRPVARKIDYFKVVEVTRLCTNGIKNGCSKLYGASARIAREMGFEMIQTYILASEDGVSLRASGWEKADGLFGGRKWNGREHLDLLGEPKRPEEMKQKYFKKL